MCILVKFVLNLLTLQTLRAKARIAANIQKSPHPNSHPLKNKCRALAVRHFFIDVYGLNVILKHKNKILLVTILLENIDPTYINLSFLIKKEKS